MAVTDASVDRERCPSTRGGYSCDRAIGHDGSHRGYDEQHDTPLFWEDLKPEDTAAIARERAVIELGLAVAEAEQYMTKWCPGWCHVLYEKAWNVIQPGRFK